MYHHNELVRDNYSIYKEEWCTSSIQKSSCIYDSSKKSNTNFVSCIIVVMSLTLMNFASNSLKFS